MIELLREWRGAVMCNMENRRFQILCTEQNLFQVSLSWMEDIAERKERVVCGYWSERFEVAVYSALREFFRQHPGSM